MIKMSSSGFEPEDESKVVYHGREVDQREVHGTVTDRKRFGFYIRDSGTGAGFSV